MSLHEMQDLASQKLDLKAKIMGTPYKLCDFRPAYGLIFSDFIKKYDFWGFGDIDIIYGNIRDFINAGLLSSYDYIGVRSDWVTGFFSLFRNTETMNTLFTKSKDYVKVFSEPDYHRFDECPLNVYDSLYHGISIYNFRWDIESITYVVKKCNDNKEVKACFEFLNTMEATPGKMVWNNGTLIYDNRVEVLFYHLIDFKKYSKGYNIVYENIPNIYYIDTNRIKYSIIDEKKLR
jgi:hypothetical protein